MALYGAPVWAETLSAGNRVRLWRPQRTLAIRVIRGYRTVSTDAACALAGTPPWDLDAEVLAEVYRRAAAARAGGSVPLPEELRGWREEAHRTLMVRWGHRLEAPRAGVRTVEALRPILEEWAVRQHGTLSFRLVQVLTGHGCFGKYLHTVARREVSPMCHHCGCGEDSAQHTLEQCPAWEVQRRELTAVIGNDLALPAVVMAMGNARSWEAVASFCEEVILQKEAAERTREDSLLADPLRRRRAGRRRRAYAAGQMPP